MKEPGIKHAWAAHVADVVLVPLAKLLHDRGRRPLVVLAYRTAADASPASNSSHRGATVQSTFESQMRLVGERCMPTASGDVAKYLSGRAVLSRRAVILAFEACYPGLSLVLPVLQRHRMPATVLLRECDLGATACPTIPGEEPALSGADIRSLAAQGIEFGFRWASDSSNDLSDGLALADRLVASRRRIEALTGAACHVFALGDSERACPDTAILRAAGLAGFRLALSDMAGANWVGALDPFGLRCQRVTVNTGLRQLRHILELADWAA